MCPTPAISTSVTRGKTFVSSRVTSRDAPGESEPVRQSVGTSSDANADSGVGSVTYSLNGGSAIPYTTGVIVGAEAGTKAEKARANE